MKIFQCVVGLNDGFVGQCDGIEHEGKLWLVPKWLKHRTEPHAIPARIIRFDNFPHRRCDSDDALDYENIQLPISETDLLGPMPPGIEYVDHPLSLTVDIHELDRH